MSLDYSMTFKLLTEQHLEFLRFKGGYTGSNESTLVKMPHCWKSYVAVQLLNGPHRVDYNLSGIATWLRGYIFFLLLNSTEHEI